MLFNIHSLVYRIKIKIENILTFRLWKALVSFDILGILHRIEGEWRK